MKLFEESTDSLQKVNYEQIRSFYSLSNEVMLIEDHNEILLN